MTRIPKAAAFSPPRWVSWLLALIPVFPPLYLVAFSVLGKLRTLPLAARGILFFFAATQLLAAIFTPQPLLSLGLALLRTIVILAMIAAGVYLKQSRNLRPLLWGQLLICGTAWLYTLTTQGWIGVQQRLSHPYYYIVSLGLIAVVAMWFVIFWKGGAAWWRWPAGILALITFVASGSRGPLLALVIGSLVALLINNKNKLLLSFTILVITVTAFLAISLNLPFKPLERLTSDQTSGREYVWQDAIRGWETSPLGGVGPYQGGAYLTYLLKEGCQLTPSLERNGVNCPDKIKSLTSIWLIAHNAWLHWMLESGIVGLSGFIVLMLYSAYKSIVLRDSFVLAIVFGFMAMNLVDVVVAIPSPHFSELWWAVVGISIYEDKPTSDVSLKRRLNV